MGSYGENYWIRSRSRGLSRRRFLLGAGAAAGSAAFLAACGGGNNANSAKAPAATKTSTAAGTTATAAATRASVSTPATAAAASPSASGEKPIRGGTLQYWKLGADQGNDPAAYHTNNGEVTNRVFNHFVSYQASKNVVSKDAVLGWEQPDPTTWIWHLRPGMTFQPDDKGATPPITAEDVAYSIMRVAAVYKARGGTHAPTAIFRYVTKAEAIDPVTVRETWSAPNASGIVHKARHYWGWVNKAITEAHNGQVLDLPKGVAAGPYTLDQRNEQGTVLNRWQGYYKHPSPDDGFVEDGPYIDTVNTRILPDRTAAKGLFGTGQLDIFGAADKLEVDEFKGNNKVLFKKIPANAWSVASMDGAQWFDVRARQALQKAIDYDGFIATIRAGDAKLRGPVADALPQFQKLTQADLKKYRTYDPANARKLWEAAAPPMSVIHILVQAGNSIVGDIANFLQQSLSKALPVKVDVQVNDLTTWVNRATDRSHPTKDWQILLTGDGLSGGSDGTPENSTLSWYDPLGYALNSFNFHHESQQQSILDGAKIVGDMIEAQQKELDVDKRVKIITDLQRWIEDNAWAHVTLPIATTSYLGVSARLRDAGFDDWFNDNVYIMRRQAMWLANT